MQKPIVRLFTENRRYAPELALTVLLLLSAGFFRTGSAYLFGSMTDLGLSGDFASLRGQIVPMLLLLLGDALRGLLVSALAAVTTEKIFHAIRGRLFTALYHVRYDRFERDAHAGDIVTRMNNDVNFLSDQVKSNFPWYLSVLFSAGVALLGCLWLSWQLSLAYFLLVPLAVWIMQKHSKPMETLQKKYSKEIGRSMDVTLDALSGLPVVKAFGLEGAMARRFRQGSREATAAMNENEKVVMKLTANKYLTKLVPLSALLGIGLWLIARQTITPGTLIAFLGMSAYVTEAVELGDYMLAGYRRIAASAERVYEVLDLEPEPDGQALSPDFSEPVCIRDLDFSYDGRRPVLSGLSFSLKPGEHVALAGGSGSGKSTLLKLLCGLYRPEIGDCRLFGHPLSAWSPQALREQISIVTQDPFLFDGSIRENLLYGRADATDAELERVLACVDLWTFVQSLPQGLNTRLGEGAMRLSGGQRQRLAIARALLKDARLVLLDEVTSALDAESEQDVQRALRVLLEGRTALMITHRLSSLNGVDRVDVLESGRIVESGTYETLLAERGRFYDLWARQQEEVGT